MEQIALSFAGLLFLTLGGGLWQAVRGTSAADSMLAVQLMGTTGVAVVALLGHAAHLRGSLDVALVFALLSGVAAVTFVRRVWPEAGGKDRP